VKQKTTGKTISIICPVRNEEEIIKTLINSLSKAHAEGAEIIVVNDGSTDKTGEYLDSAKFIKVLHIANSKGFGGAVKSGMEIANGDVVAWMPGNLRVVPTDTLKLAQQFSEKCDEDQIFVKAKRQGRPKFDQITSVLAGVALSVFARRNLFDTGATPTIVTRAAVKHLSDGPDDITFECYALWKLPKCGYRVIRPEIQYYERLIGKSHWNFNVYSRVRLLMQLLKSIQSFR